MRLLILSLLAIIPLSACGESSPTKSPCDGRQWKNSGEEIDCRFPPPPIGRWHTVYTKEFAKAHDLPPENISTDLSPGVDYMEMDVQPYGNGGVACLVNMLVKKPHDIAFYPRHIPPLPEDRKLMHLIDLDHLKEKIKGTGAFSSASRDYKIEKSGYERSTIAMYVEDALPGYDYISANQYCRDVSMHPQYFPDGYAFWINRASIWGKYEQRFKHMEDYGRPKSDEDFQKSHFFISIPRELISTIFKDVPLGGQ
ncbi:MAG: hypothetical protein R3D88_08350 [Alphaproteobacteria bacterium]|nr:hypothetical protein [Alphaproteobacteria bacterium]